MLKQLRYVVTAAFVVSLTMAGPATAQETLGFTIDPTMGLPGGTVSGQVNPADIAAHCVTTLEAFQARFQALLDGPFVGGNTVGDLPQRFFPDPNNIIYENYDQVAYVLTLFTVFGIAQDVNGAAAGALPQTFVMTFADIATQEPVGELGSFDPVTGVGSVVVPDVACGLWAVAAACVGPVFDLDLLEAGIRESTQFLVEIGYQFDVGLEGPLSPTAVAFMQDFLDSDLEGFDLFIAFLQAIGPDLLQPIVTPDALGVQIFTIPCPPTPTSTPEPTATPTPPPTPETECERARCAVQATLDEECPCNLAANHGSYVRCVAQVVNRLAKAGTIAKNCKGKIRRCAARSVCGKEGAVICQIPRVGSCDGATCPDGTACVSDADCGTKCKIKRSAEQCLARGGMVTDSPTCCADCSP
jgi:hypothetical protein